MTSIVLWFCVGWVAGLILAWSLAGRGRNW